MLRKIKKQPYFTIIVWQKHTNQSYNVDMFQFSQ